MSTKPFNISKRIVWDAWKCVKANRGAAGIDQVSLDDFESELAGNLYKLWNRMASGSYFPPPVRRVDIPKGDGKTRPLGIPTVADRVAQMVVKMVMEPAVEPIFHPDSYGYRPGKSAIDAVRTTRKRCWEYNWVVDLDIKGFFDNIDHTLMMKAVSKHAPEKWCRLYIKRWLTAPVVMPDGALVSRDRGTPQGGVISPLLANLFLHYALDRWLVTHAPQSPFERYADDMVIHCRTQFGAEKLLTSLDIRLRECGLALHPEKTQIVYCKDSNRKGSYPHIAFDFLGFCFMPRKAVTRTRKIFTSFTPAISSKALKRISTTIGAWKIQKWSGRDPDEIAKALNPVISGWLYYYGHFGKSRLQVVRRILDFALVRWARMKYRKLSRSYRKSRVFIGRLKTQSPRLFAHW